MKSLVDRTRLVIRELYRDCEVANTSMTEK